MITQELLNQIEQSTCYSCGDRPLKGDYVFLDGPSCLARAYPIFYCQHCRRQGARPEIVRGNVCPLGWKLVLVGGQHSITSSFADWSKYNAGTKNQSQD